MGSRRDHGPARAFAAEHRRRPTIAELAERAGLSPIAVRRALHLGKSAAQEKPGNG
jgi:lambda repressor-like predicted transcriptional regulator